MQRVLLLLLLLIAEVVVGYINSRVSQKRRRKGKSGLEVPGSVEEHEGSCNNSERRSDGYEFFS